MFGFNKIKEAQKKAEELQNELVQLEFTGESMNGLTKVRISGKRKLLSVDINENALKVRSKEDVEAMVLQAVNEALQYVEDAQRDLLSRSLPNVPGLNF